MASPRSAPPFRSFLLFQYVKDHLSFRTCCFLLTMQRYDVFFHSTMACYSPCLTPCLRLRKLSMFLSIFASLPCQIKKVSDKASPDGIITISPRLLQISNRTNGRTDIGHSLYIANVTNWTLGHVTLSRFYPQQKCA